MEKLFSKLKLFNNFHSFSIKKNQVCFMIIEIYVTCYICNESTLGDHVHLR